MSLKQTRIAEMLPFFLCLPEEKLQHEKGRIIPFPSSLFTDPLSAASREYKAVSSKLTLGSLLHLCG